jgi:thiamine kinase-like enzyme
LPYEWDQEYLLNRSTSVNPKETLSQLEFDSLLSDIKAVGIHGDLQFDNVIYLENGGFKLIDWRTSFGSNYVNGDIYYDLAKLLGGIEMDYSKIKKGNFTFQIMESEVSYEFPPTENHEVLRSELESFCRKEGYNWEKVCYLTGIIYINMCPLHTRPFRDLLFFHSIYHLSRKNH